MKKALLVLGAVLLTGAGCISGSSPSTSTEIKAPPQPISPQPPQPQPTSPQLLMPNEQGFKPVVGQKYGAFTLQRIEEESLLIFTGTANVSGRFAITEMDPQLCFTPDNASATKIPDVWNGAYTIEFCFSNAEEAKKLLGTDEGSATIAIDGYRVDYLPSSGRPNTILVRVISKK